MGWVSVHANVYQHPEAGTNISLPLEVKVWGDNTLIAHYKLTKNSQNNFTQETVLPSAIPNVTLTEPVMRLPATVAQEWEVEVQGVDINEFCLAQSMAEIQSV